MPVSGEHPCSQVFVCLREMQSTVNPNPLWPYGADRGPGAGFFASSLACLVPLLPPAAAVPGVATSVLGSASDLHGVRSRGSRFGEEEEEQWEEEDGVYGEHDGSSCGNAAATVTTGSNYLCKIARICPITRTGSSALHNALLLVL